MGGGEVASEWKGPQGEESATICVCWVRTVRLLYTGGTTAYFDLLLEDFLTTKVFF